MITSKIFAHKRIVSILKITRQSSSGVGTSARETKFEKIKIPKRIKRGPTDILQALAGTVSKDFTAPHYKYIDDPFFIPASNVTKRSYALSKESGRKAAQWIFSQNPKLFEIVEVNPKLESFFPSPIYDENSDVSETILKECIQKSSVQKANVVYQLLMKKKVSVSAETQQSLLELLCFYNSQDPLVDDGEEKWFRQPTRNKRKTWLDGGLAEQLFNNMTEKTPEAYCTMICGMAKFLQVNRAYALYQEMQEKQLPTDVTTYNSLIPLCTHIRDSNELRWQQCEQFLMNMHREGVEPNIQTFNSVLELLSRMPTWRNSKKLVLETMGEMKALRIEPSLASYNYLLHVYCREGGPISTILYDVMKEIEGKEFKIRDPRDVTFFVTTMSVCHSHLMDKDLAMKIHELLNTGRNYNLIGDSMRESIYYQHLFKILCFADSLENFFQFYRKYVPSVYTPEPSVMLEIIQAVELNSAWQYIPQLWTDIILFDQFYREALLHKILKVVAENTPEGELQQQFFEIAWYIKERLDSQDADKIRNIISWTGQMLGNVMQACMNAKQFEKAWEVLKQCQDEQLKIFGVLDEKVLTNFLNVCIDNKDVKRAMECLRYISDSELSNVKFVEIVFKLPLTDNEKSKVRHLMGSQGKLAQDN